MMPPSDADLLAMLGDFIAWHAHRLARRAHRPDWYDDLRAEGLCAMIAAARRANWAARNPLGYVRSWIKGYQQNWVRRQVPGVRDQHHRLVAAVRLVSLAEVSHL